MAHRTHLIVSMPMPPIISMNTSHPQPTHRRDCCHELGKTHHKCKLEGHAPHRHNGRRQLASANPPPPRLVTLILTRSRPSPPLKLASRPKLCILHRHCNMSALAIPPPFAYLTPHTSPIVAPSSLPSLPTLSSPLKKSSKVSFPPPSPPSAKADVP